MRSGTDAQSDEACHTKLWKTWLCACRHHDAETGKGIPQTVSLKYNCMLEHKSKTAPVQKYIKTCEQGCTHTYSVLQFNVSIWPSRPILYYMFVCSGSDQNIDWMYLIAAEWPLPPKPSVNRIWSLNGPVEQTHHPRSRQLTVLSERERKSSEWRAREHRYIHTLSWGVHVMKTGHSRVVGTVGAFPCISGGTVLDICKARELNKDGGPGSNLTEAVM